MIKRVIFNADDFNLTTGVNNGIIEAHRFGVVKSTSIMINLQGAEDAVRLLKKNPNLDVGLHVNLTFGHPVSSTEEVRSLVDDEGKFWRKPSLLFKSAVTEDLRKEIIAQVELAQKMGLKLTHLDSHHHIHQADKRVSEIFMELALKHHLGIRSINKEFRSVYRKAGIPTPDNFTDDFYDMQNITIESLEQILETMPSGTSEIMCHPGFSDEELADKSSYEKPRQIEISVLTHPRTMQMLQRVNAKIIGYRELLEFFPGYEKSTK